MSFRSSRSPLLPPLQTLIETAHLHAALSALCHLMTAAIDNGRAAREVKRIEKDIKIAEAHNARLRLRLDMMRCPEWRARVLRELGGEKALGRWERLSQNLARRLGVHIPQPPLKRHKILNPFGTPAQRLARAANLKKARAALLERSYRCDLDNPRQSAQTHVKKDGVTVDHQGQFRLAPIPRPDQHRGQRPCKRPCQPPVQHAVTVIPKTPAQINVPKTRGVTAVKQTYIKYRKLDPIPIWPSEFREAENVEETDVSAQALHAPPFNPFPSTGGADQYCGLRPESPPEQ